MPEIIHGKEYATVDERVAEFHKLYPNGKLVFKLFKSNEGMFVGKATATPDVDKPERYFTGHAYEVIGSTQINKTSALENCETSAHGRALGFLNIGLNGSIATGDEVANAIHQQNKTNVEIIAKEKKNWQTFRDNLVGFGKKNKNLKWSEVFIDDLHWLANESKVSTFYKERARNEINFRNEEG